MVVRTLSLVQKGQTRGCSGCSMQWHSSIWWWRHCLWCKKVKPLDAVCSGHSGIVIYGGGQTSGCSGCSHTVDTVHCVTASTGLTFLPHIPLFHCILRPLHPVVQPFCTKDNVPTTIYHYSTVYCILHPLHPVVQPFCPKDNVLTTIYHYFTASTAYCIHLFDLFAPKTMSPLPYITIPLCPLHTSSTGLTFLHQRTMSPPPYTTIPLHTASTASSGLTFLHQRTMSPPPYTTILLCPLHTVYCIQWFDLFASKNNVPTTIYHYSTASTAYCVHTIESLLCNSYTT